MFSFQSRAFFLVNLWRKIELSSELMARENVLCISIVKKKTAQTTSLEYTVLDCVPSHYSLKKRKVMFYNFLGKDCLRFICKFEP